MKTQSIKTTVTAVVAAAALMSSGIAPVSQASADPFNPVLTGKVKPMKPNPCLANPVLCNPGFKAPPPQPAPPPKPGMSAGTAAALVVGGILVGSAIAKANKQQQASAAGDAHIAWCFDHYKSYRLYDNSYKPYHGPRKPCISPYL